MTTENAETQPAVVRSLRLKSPSDLFGGGIILGLGSFALWNVHHLPLFAGIGVGSGFAPKILSTLLILLGATIVALSFVHHGDAAPRFNFRGTVFIAGSVLAFALAIKPLGLAIAAPACFIIASRAMPETGLVATLVTSIVLTIGTILLFHTLLGLSMPVWPQALSL